MSAQTYSRGYQEMLRLDALAGLLREDRGVACGRSYISEAYKCSTGKAGELRKAAKAGEEWAKGAIEKTIQRTLEAHDLKAEIKGNKTLGMKARNKQTLTNPNTSKTPTVKTMNQAAIAVEGRRGQAFMSKVRSEVKKMTEASGSSLTNAATPNAERAGSTEVTREVWEEAASKVGGRGGKARFGRIMKEARRSQSEAISKSNAKRAKKEGLKAAVKEERAKAEVERLQRRSRRPAALGTVSPRTGRLAS